MQLRCAEPHPEMGLIQSQAQCESKGEAGDAWHATHLTVDACAKCLGEIITRNPSACPQASTPVGRLTADQILLFVRFAVEPIIASTVEAQQRGVLDRGRKGVKPGNALNPLRLDATPTFCLAKVTIFFRVMTRLCVDA